MFIVSYFGLETSVTGRAVDNTGLLVHLEFEEGVGTTTADSSGKGNNGALNNNPMWSTDRKVGSFSLRFDGVDDYVDFGFLDINGDKMTIAAWVKPDDIANRCVFDDCRIVVKSDGTGLGKTNWMLAVDDTGIIGDKTSGIKMRVRAGGTTKELKSNRDVLQDGVWTHVAAVYDGNNMILYADGSEVGRASKSGVIDKDSNRRSWVGAGPPIINDEFPGRIDSVRIYERALSLSEIQSLANSGNQNNNQGPVCGNKIVESGELCDSNSKSCLINNYNGVQFCNNQCSGWLTCQANEFCGDKIVNGNEICDGNSKACVIGGYNGMQQCNNVCNGWNVCSTTEFCGDGKVNGNEQCDDGNNVNGDGCSNLCVTESNNLCGNNVCDTLKGESCNTCPSDCGQCPTTPVCGDNKCTGSETCASCPNDCGQCPTPTPNQTHKECDFMNQKCIIVQGAGVDQCQFDWQCVNNQTNQTPQSYCGDGICTSISGESCSTCQKDCGVCQTLVSSCGNKVCELSLGETCVSCSADCGQCPTTTFKNFFCGDKVCDVKIGEGCLSCTKDCGQCSIPKNCGNEIIDVGEECDDGSENSNIYPDSCRLTCKLPKCGDGIVDSEEGCDDGNNVNGDGCSNLCEIDDGFICVGGYRSYCGFYGADSDKDGVPDSLDLCPTENYGDQDILGRPLPVLTGFDSGVTTDLNYENVQSVHNFRIGRVGEASIFYKDQEVDLITGAESNCLSLFMDQLIFIEPGYVEVLGDLFPTLNKPAQITFYNILYKNPGILKDGEVCFECEIVSYSNNILVVDVPGFSSYEIVDGDYSGFDYQRPTYPDYEDFEEGDYDPNVQTPTQQTPIQGPTTTPRPTGPTTQEGDIKRNVKVESPLDKYPLIPKEISAKIKSALREPVKFVYENPAVLIIVSMFVVMFLGLRTYYRAIGRD